MKNDLNRRLFTAKDIKKYFGITPGQLFHWGRTWGLIKPEVKAEGRQGKDKYSLKNLFFLSLIKELTNFGISLSTIREIVKYSREYIPYNYGKLEDIYEYVKKVDDDHCYLTIYVWKIRAPKKYKEKYKNLTEGTGISWGLEKEDEISRILSYSKRTKSVLIIDLKKLMSEIEEIINEE
ncbi:MAG: MerR family transcriptional regulator [Promethearchaeota archaeon]